MTLIEASKTITDFEIELPKGFSIWNVNDTWIFPIYNDDRRDYVRLVYILFEAKQRLHGIEFDLRYNTDVLSRLLRGGLIKFQEELK